MRTKKEILFCQGNHACALAAFDAGSRFYAGYPITPSSEVAEVAAHELPKLGGVYMQMEDEIASMAAIVGASLAGAKSFTATSGPGFSLMQENLGMAIYAEVPCVIINVQRVGPSTGLATKPAQGDVMQTRWGTHGDHAIIALSPASVQECYDLTIEAFNLAEKYRTPVILLSDEVVGHMREKLELPPSDELTIVNRERPQGNPQEYLSYQPGGRGVPPMAAYGDKYLMHITSSCHDETGYSNSKAQVANDLLRRLDHKINSNYEDIVRYKQFGPEQADITIIAYGCTTRTAREAMQQALKKGLSVKTVQLQTIWPFADQLIAKICAESKGILVPELNMGQLVGEVLKINNGRALVRSYSRTNGEIFSPQEILAALEEVEKCLS